MLIPIAAVIISYILGFGTSAVLSAAKAEDIQQEHMAEIARRDLECKHKQ